MICTLKTKRKSNASWMDAKSTAASAAADTSRGTQEAVGDRWRYKDSQIDRQTEIRIQSEKERQRAREVRPKRELQLLLCLTLLFLLPAFPFQLLILLFLLLFLSLLFLLTHPSLPPLRAHTR